jgi:hypothetical protein
MRYLVFETDLFFTDIPDDQLDHWFIGGDCAGWFYARLLPHESIKQDLDPTMEDWGWIMSVKSEDFVVDICVWEYLEKRNHWLLGIEAKKKLLKKNSLDLLERSELIVVDALTTILQNDNRFVKYIWCDENPMEKPIESLY